MIRSERRIPDLAMNRKEIELLRRQFPPGTKVKCTRMMEDTSTVPPGTTGIVSYVDDSGMIHVNWENGSRLGLISGEDRFKKVTRKEMER